MFAIYGTSGLMYRGPMEGLRKVAPALRSARVRALDPQTDEVAAALGEPLDLPEAGPRNAQQALSAYGQVQHPKPPRRLLQLVSDVMSLDAVTLMQAMTVRQGWQVLHEHGVGQAPVLSDEGLVVGLLSRAELMRTDKLPQPDGRAILWQALMSQSVATLMVSPVPCATPQTDLRRLAYVLLDTGLQGLPVVDAQGGVVGFVTRSDILKALVHDPPLDLWAG